MKVVFMGTPDFAVPSLREIGKSNHQIISVVTGPDKPRGRGQKLSKTPVKEAAEKLNLTILQPEKLDSPEFSKQIEKLEPDIFVVVAFRILPESLLQIPRKGAINLHASLLPRYRGAAPINWAIINGERETGITIFQIKPEVDTGEILYQEKIEIKEDDTAGSLHDKLSRIGAKALVRVLDMVERGEVKPIPQNEKLATYAPKIKPEMGRIDWSKEAKNIKNLIHGLSPVPGAFSFFKNKRVRFLKANIEDTGTSYSPGTIVYLDKKCMKIQTGRGLLLPSMLQTEGKKPLTVTEFIKGFRGNTGDRFIS
ncbi:MAG: methionyl-tRNA formyltransferase [Candidatus Neomarinimicrobiota bacterium]|nr:methionyl-tRNA formyltransferase [Candidatus Neomarinimicrobiota bacterium]RKY52508.1 MAG: methionyl-tRNA formyltransferase [Candidatus Neomarinimicrobiota bacterium]